VITFPPPSPIADPIGALIRVAVAEGDEELDGIAGDPEQPNTAPNAMNDIVRTESRHAHLIWRESLS
jgi:hypothetical protein